MSTWVALGSLLVASWLVWQHPAVDPHAPYGAMGASIATYIKLALLGVGLLLVLIGAQEGETIIHVGDDGNPSSVQKSAAYQPARALRGESLALFLFSLTGAMLCASATDLVWLFLALELTSLPTYVMVATSRNQIHAQESAVKYFFLGAMAAAVFLYGFALLYGATGSTQYGQMSAYLHDLTVRGEAPPTLFVTGLVMAVVGLSFKIAAVPMHFYAADVYQGAAHLLLHF